MIRKRKDLFLRRNAGNYEGGNIQTIFNLREHEGEVGLEVEVEGNQFPKPYEYDDYGDEVKADHGLIPDRWEYTHDGSLRGDDNAEYILQKPTKLSEVPEALDELWDMFDKFGSVLDESNRTSIHVHLNAQKWHINRVCAFVGLYFIVEDILTHWCGDHRVGNLFCLRAKDAPGIISRLKQFFKTEHGAFLNSGLHYSGLNALALKKLGSIEIRTMRGVNNPDTIKTWVAILGRMYEMSAAYTDPREIVHGFSGQSRVSFLRSILGPYTGQVIEECGMDMAQISTSLNEGIRIAQSLCYCRNWSEYKTINCVPDAFGRLPQTQGEMPQPLPNTAQDATQEASEVSDPWLQSAADLIDTPQTWSSPNAASNIIWSPATSTEDSF